MPAAPATLRELRALLGQRFPDAVPVPCGTVEGVATGIAALDAILPGVESVALDVRVLSLGWSRHTRFTLPVLRHELRTALEPGFPDRRSVTAPSSISRGR